MRGKVEVKVADKLTAGITPAYAGKSRRDRQRRRKNQDHPRICGEKRCGKPYGRRHPGSPPHMRGKAHLPSFCANSLRITPAYAGKSGTDKAHHVRIGDHPRICGEKPKVFRPSAMREGSPPHMRGKVHVFRCSLVSCGITPAYAGKRLREHFGVTSPEDHPRICGEKTVLFPVFLPLLGSPPHMRGKD